MQSMHQLPDLLEIDYNESVEWSARPILEQEAPQEECAKYVGPPVTEYFFKGIKKFSPREEEEEEEDDAETSISKISVSNNFSVIKPIYAQKECEEFFPSDGDEELVLAGGKFFIIYV